MRFSQNIITWLKYNYEQGVWNWVTLYIRNAKKQDLSSDEKILLDILLQRFQLNSNLEDIKTESQDQLCNRYRLQLPAEFYTFASNPGGTLKYLALYVIRVYTPIWFVISYQKTQKNGIGWMGGRAPAPRFIGIVGFAVT